jgi:hypothetical protein
MKALIIKLLRKLLNWLDPQPPSPQPGATIQGGGGTGPRQ